MEKLKHQLCTLLPHSCQQGIAEPKQALRPEINLPGTRETVSANKPVKKLWSVYEGVYWI